MNLKTMKPWEAIQKIKGTPDLIQEVKKRMSDWDIVFGKTMKNFSREQAIEQAIQNIRRSFENDDPGEPDPFTRKIIEMIFDAGVEWKRKDLIYTVGGQ